MFSKKSLREMLFLKKNEKVTTQSLFNAVCLKIQRPTEQLLFYEL